mmetsp:Transcript_4700/g.8013  ORF Transcript_4700/g.8013 Transcript_4700/m.8013 type:complete len:132 (+) Transcript_4700:1165-1560(+)
MVDGEAMLKWDQLDSQSIRERAMSMVKPRRKKVVVGNWKSNGDSQFIEQFSEEVLNQIKFNDKLMDVMVAPTMIHLHKTNNALYSNVQVCAQDISKYPSGAFTGQVSAGQVLDMDCKWSIIGHSERKIYNE